MRFALVDGQRHLPKKGLKGFCPVCGSPVMARCGEVRGHHWAHVKGMDCADTWNTGKETDWHLGWKNKFPEEWQERILKDTTTGEKHIADVLTDKNLVVEFQHSPIQPDERRARETFYTSEGRRMVWVVDGRSKISRAKIESCFSYCCSRRNKLNWYDLPFPDDFFPAKWTRGEGRVPIAFDCNFAPGNYGGYNEVSQLMPVLMSDINGGLVCWMQKRSFVELVRQSRLHEVLFAHFIPKSGKQVTPQKSRAASPQPAQVPYSTLPGSNIRINTPTPGYGKRRRRF